MRIATVASTRRTLNLLACVLDGPLLPMIDGTKLGVFVVFITSSVSFLKKQASALPAARNGDAA
jgi:hypothetical protein